MVRADRWSHTQGWLAWNCSLYGKIRLLWIRVQWYIFYYEQILLLASTSASGASEDNGGDRWLVSERNHRSSRYQVSQRLVYAYDIITRARAHWVFIVDVPSKFVCNTNMCLFRGLRKLWCDDSSDEGLFWAAEEIGSQVRILFFFRFSVAICCITADGSVSEFSFYLIMSCTPSSSLYFVRYVTGFISDILGKQLRPMIYFNQNSIWALMRNETGTFSWFVFL